MKKTLVFALVMAILGSLFTANYVSASTYYENDIVSLGEYHSAVIKNDNTLWVWGTNTVGQIGNSSTKEALVPLNILKQAKLVKLGYQHSAAIMQDNSLHLWGYNLTGQLGNGTNQQAVDPVKVMDDVKAVALGKTHTAAIKNDGTLWMWGDNTYGQLGNGTTASEKVPTKTMDNVRAVELGELHTIVIKNDGTVWAWGDNSNGQLGTGSRNGSSKPVKIAEDAIAIDAAYRQSAFIKSDGTLWMWGEGGNGQLGDGKNTSYSKPTQITENVIAIALGRTHSMAVKNDGTLWTWGDNTFGQLGNGLRTSSLTPVKVAENVTAISAAYNQSAMVKNDGTLWMWGSNREGQFGNGKKGNGEYASIPEKVMNDVAIKEKGVEGFTTFAEMSKWAEKDVKEAIALGLVAEELQSDYTVPITRLDFCKLAYAVHEKVMGKTAGVTEMKFTDLDTITAEDKRIISIVNQLGIVSGYDDNTFKPGNKITRQEAASMLMRTAKAVGMADVADNTANSYVDCDSVAGWAMGGIKYVCSAGIMSGTSVVDNGSTVSITFGPYDNYTREQAMITYYRLYNKVANN